MTKSARDKVLDDTTLENIAHKLYTIDGDCSPGLRKAIDTTRQLINEEFVHNKKQVTSQVIYDLMYPAIQAELDQIDESEDRDDYYK